MSRLNSVALFVATAALLCTMAHAQTFKIKSDPDNARLVDEHGRTIIMHGVNAVSKVYPFHPDFEGTFDPDNSFNDKDIENLKAWGMTVVRLGVMWPGVETAPGVYNQTYLTVMKDFVKKLDAAGIHTIVDMHQDVMSEKFCGEGFPEFHVHVGKHALKFPRPARFRSYELDEHGHPARSDCKKMAFAKYYLASETAAAWQSFYENVGNSQDAFVKFWGVVAEAFADVPGVLGYEPINEPFIGDFYAHPWLLLAGRGDLKHLQPLYARVHEAIRAHDDERIIFYEPMAVFDILRKTGFTQGPGGPEYDDRQVFSYHVYCAQSSNGDPVNLKFCSALEKRIMGAYVKDAGRLHNTGMLTEFGANTEGAMGIGELHNIGALADQHLQSWQYWQFKTFGDITTMGDAAEGFYDEHTGELQSRKVKALARTYPYAVAGLPTELVFDPETSAFSLTYTATAAIDMPTDIRLCEKLNYPGGYDGVATVNGEPAGDNITFTTTPGHLFLQHVGLSEGDVVVVKITAIETPPALFV